MAGTIADIEKPQPHNRWWKIKNLFVKGWIYLKFSSGQGKEGNLWKIFLFFFTRQGILFIGKFFTKALYLIFRINLVGKLNKKAYKHWFRKNKVSESSLKKFRKEAREFSHQPLISILIPDLKGDLISLEKTVFSLTEQVYHRWELCVAIPASLSGEQFLQHPSIKLLLPDPNATNAGTLNQLLEVAQGDFFLCMTPGDLLMQDGLYHWVNHMQEARDTQILYADEDKMNRKGHCSIPFFKPDWSPDTLLSYNYLGKAVLLHTMLVKESGGFRKEFDGEEMYDLYLRATERTNKIQHFNNILYRQKIRPYRSDRRMIAQILAETLARRNESGDILLDNEKNITIAEIRYQIREYKKVSILIPTKDNTFLISQCIRSIFELSTYPDFEVIVIDNNSREKEFFEYMADCEKKYAGRFSCLRHEVPFNFSEINNFAASHAKGEYLVLLNNDTKLITPQWLECMVAQAQRNQTGVVGVKLLFPDDSIQHAGIGFDEHQLPFHVFAEESKDMASPQVNITSNFAALTAACIMVRKELYERAGGLDKALAVEFNDIDLCLRIKKMGYYNLYLPYVELYHYESLSRGSSHSSGDKYERHLQEKNLFLSRWSEYIKSIPVKYLSFQS